MLKNKNVLIIISAIIICIVVALVGIFIWKKANSENGNKNETEEQKNKESSFTELFNNKKYLESSEEIVTTIYEYEKTQESKYEIDVHIPQINLETCENINEEILEIFGTKLLDIVKNNNKYTRYKIDYTYYINGDIISLIIKAVLKEGSTAQRTIVKTYNYDVKNSENISLENMLKDKNLDKNKVQKQINKEIREKNSNAEVLANQGYNIYVRDLNSEEYKIENIQNYYLDENGALYIIFAYGNNNYTETMDIIKL